MNVWRLSNYFYLEVFYRLHLPVATMDDLIEDILAELLDPVPEGQQFTDLHDQVPPSVRLPADQWVEILNDAGVVGWCDGAGYISSAGASY